MNSIKKTLFLSTVLIAGMAFTPQAIAETSAHKGEHQEAVSHDHHKAAPAEHGAVMGKGIVHSIDLDNRKINVSHEPIPALKWPKMTMELDVAEGVDLTALTPDQKIQFHIELGEDKVYRITKVMKPGEGHHEAKQCEAGMDCPMHEDMKHGGDHGDGHGDHH